MGDWTTASEGELKAAADAIQREWDRRTAMDETARVEKFRGELEEIRTGQRAVGPEHVAHLTPRETVDAINKGLVPGVGADRRLGRSR
jgi:hypothetical protein